MSVIQNCRICKNSNLDDIIDLGEQIITSRFPIYGDFSTPKTNITLSLCNDCGLVQLKETTSPEEIYEYEYGYVHSNSCFKLFVLDIFNGLKYLNFLFK